ncbi:three component ABC system middle component [uncultured Pseudomonas sp.]|uniref:three component ABC system middle component n=1 Tax=uncultured Pseudomonas sp. TaxID=114707 RepID=UPI00258FB49B|nr:three component ABC system middle component [uncultured Pseudomonas sp.]
MSTQVSDHLYTLHRTPFALAPVIQSFYQHWEPVEKDILLSYLILPIVTYKPMHAFLNRARRDSSIRTMASDAERLIGLAMRVDEFKPITNAAMLILTAENSLEITPELSVRSLQKPQAINSDKSLLKYSQKLAMVLSGENVVSIYRMLGLKSL